MAENKSMRRRTTGQSLFDLPSRRPLQMGLRNKVAAKSKASASVGNVGKKAKTVNVKKGKQMGKVSKDDDESLSDSGSEVGWDSEEDQFLSSHKHEKRDRYAIDEDEDDEGGILLSDMLFTSKPAKKAGPKDKKVVIQPPAREDSESEVVDSDEEELEDLPEEDSVLDDAERNVDDEVEVDDNDSSEGSASGSANGSEDESDEELDDDDDDYDEDRHERLLSSINQFATSKATNSSAQGSFRSQLLPEHSVLGYDENLSMNALLGELHESAGLNAVRSALTELEAKKGVPKYVEKVVATRMERQETYSSTKADMDKWHEPVMTNRNSAQLDLANDKRQVTRAKDLVNKFRATNDLEREISMVLVKSGATEALQEQKEVELLQARNMSMDEIKQRQAELAKVNALMFYEQMKRHRINKIKSKAYRSIRRKQKRRAEGEEGGDAGEEDGDAEDGESAELEEQRAFDRVKERMDLKHKNTGKWAKMALQYGHTDKSLRDAYHESVRLGQELGKKMKERVGRGDGDDEDDGGEFEGEHLAEQAQKEFKELFDADNQEASLAVNGKYKKLFEMDFMKKANEQQKLRAREEAQQVLKEIQAWERDGSGDDSDAGEGSSARPAQSVEEKKATRKEVNALFKNNLAGGFQLNLTNHIVSASGTSDVPSVAIASSTDAGREDSHQAGSQVQKKDKKKKDKQTESATAAVEEAASNPWMDSSAALGNSVGKKRGAHQLGVKTKGQEGESAATLLIAEPQSASVAKRQEKNAQAKNQAISSESQPTEDTSNAPKKSLTNKSQDELVQMAFAVPDFESEFLAQKQQEIDRELGLDEKKLKVLRDVKAGWGDWAGPGGMEVSQKIVDKRNKLIMQVQKDNEIKRLDRKDAKMAHVMISERRITNAAKYKVADVPYPFKSREEYERSLQMPLGSEWNASQVVNKLTAPEIKKRTGRIIEPIKLPRKHTSAAADTGSSKKQKTKK